jgi:hypothetical protein
MKAPDRLLQFWRFSKVHPYIPRGARVLDIGCADGALFRLIENKIHEGVGLDPALTFWVKVKNEEHYGFDPRQTLEIFSMPGLSLVK